MSEKSDRMRVPNVGIGRPGRCVRMTLAAVHRQLAAATLRLLGRWRAVILAATTLLVLISSPAAAIDIILEYDDEGSNPSWDFNGKKLEAIAIAAAQYWEAILPEPETYNVQFEWDDLGADGPLGLWTGGIEINSNANYTWFLDRTPLVNEEFHLPATSGTSPEFFGQTFYRDLLGPDQAEWFYGPVPALLEVGYRWDNIWVPAGTPPQDDPSNYDLFSTFVHELGHELGVNFELDDSFGIRSEHVGGASGVAAEADSLSGHIAAQSTLMCDGCEWPGMRRFPSATDILVIAYDQGFSQLNMPRTDYLGGTDFSNPLAWIGGLPAANTQAMVRRNVSDVNATASANLTFGDLTLVEGSRVNTGGNTLDVAGDLTVDGAGSGTFQTTLTVSSGGKVSAESLTVDNGASIVVDGATAVANFNSNLAIGSAGQARMDILNAADVSNTDGVAGHLPGSSGAVTVSGPASTWANSGNLWVALAGTGTLEVSNGGSVSNTAGYVAFWGGSSGAVTVSGLGSTWTNSLELKVGILGSATLVITDGGTVWNAAGYVGFDDGSSGAVIVSGAGSRWANSGDLSVGYNDGGEAGTSSTATLAITDGGGVSNTAGYVSYYAGADGAVTVSGPGSTWTNSGDLEVGHGDKGTLDITNGGAVSNVNGVIGDDSTTGDGKVTVYGIWSTWTNSGTLKVADEGTGTLEVTNGASVSNTTGYVGYEDGSLGTVTVSGAGSTWTNTSSLSVGYNDGGEAGTSSTGTLTITDGGTVSNTSGSVATSSGSSGAVTVSGVGSRWTNSAILDVGNRGAGTLAITNGGTVSNTAAYVGYYAGSDGAVTVSGPASRWANSGELYVASWGTGTLAVINGGRVSSTSGYVGSQNGSSGAVIVRGIGSTWSNSGNLDVGNAGTGRLTIRDGGAVSASQTLTLANQAGSSGTVNLQGGSLSAESIGAGAGTAQFNWTGGSLAITGAGGLTLDGGLLGPIIGINHNKGLSVSAATTVNSGVKLAVTGGTYSTDTLNVSGTAQLHGGTITIGDTFAVNAGGELEITGQDLLLLSPPTLQGDLVLDQTTLSAPSMTVAAGASLDLDSGRVSLGGTFDNQEVVRMGNTGPATLRADLLNNSGALMGKGTIQAPVTNTGNIGLSGDSSFTGDVTNQPGGKIIVSAGSAVTFFEDVDNRAGVPDNAEIRVSQNSTATYFGDLTGGGSFTGTGTSYIEGDLRPGASPAEISFGGDVVFGSAAGLQIELADPDAGPANDRLDVAGDVYLDGTLTVEALSNLGTVGDLSRTIITSGGPGGVSGTFAHVPEVGDYLGDGVWFGNDKTGEGVIYVGGPDVVTAVDIAVFQAIAGDANGDRAFNFADLVQIFSASGAVYGNPAPPPEQAPDWLGGDFTADAAFSFADLIKAFGDAGAHYGAPSYPTAALEPPGAGAVSLLYDRATGRLSIDAGDAELAALSIESAAGLLQLTPEADALLDGFADVANTGQFAKLDLSGMSSLDFGAALAAMLSESDLLADLTVTGALLGGGTIENVSLNVTAMPEPGTLVLLVLGTLALVPWLRRRRTA